MYYRFELDEMSNLKFDEISLNLKVIGNIRYEMIDSGYCNTHNSKEATSECNASKRNLLGLLY